MDKKVYDMIIIGGGPAGYTTALYAARAGIDAVLIEKMAAGGQMTQSHQIDNYPGFEEGIDGFSLAVKMQQQAERFGAQTHYAEVVKADLNANPKMVETTDGTFYGKTVVLAMGAGPRELGLANENDLIGRGVAYCAACDGMFYRGKTVVVIGGGDTAASDALLLSRIVDKVILVHRRDTLRATKIYHEPLMKAKNVEFIWNSTLTEYIVDSRLVGVKTKNKLSNKINELSVDAVFVSIGRKPNVELVDGKVELDKAGYIVADESCRTNIPGVFAVGDVRTKALRQVVTAAADGATCSHYVEEYLASLY
jgi:thioredoxin reductase (NADPH)